MFGHGGNAQVPEEEGSLTQSLVTDSGPAASLCIMCSALVQGLRNKSGKHFAGPSEFISVISVLHQD